MSLPRQFRGRTTALLTEIIALLIDMPHLPNMFKIQMHASLFLQLVKTNNNKIFYFQ